MSNKIALVISANKTFTAHLQNNGLANYIVLWSDNLSGNAVAWVFAGGLTFGSGLHLTDAQYFELQLLFIECGAYLKYNS